MRISVVQMTIMDGEPEINKEKAESLIDSSDADLFLLPELWSCGYVNHLWGKIADEKTPETLVWMSEFSKRKNIWLGGSLIIREKDNSLRNRFVLFDRQGVQVMYYDKTHLFHPLLEEEYLVAGDIEPPIVDVEGVRVAALICYDLRFPEMIRNVALKGVDLFLVVSEWPKPRQYALRTLAEARAVENQVYLTLSNRVGFDGQGNDFCGESAIVGPNGIIAEAGGTEVAVSGFIDIESLVQLRASFPVLEHRRLGIDFIKEGNI